MRERLDREYFENLYRGSRDPWNFETSDYEREKYRRTLGALEGRRYRRALEVGASIGVFTEMLTPLCDELLAVDVSEKAVAVARVRVEGLRHVRVERRTLPEEMPDGSFDLILASEVLYYLPAETVLRALRDFEDALAPGGVLLAVHWRKETETYPLLGDEVHEILTHNTRLENTLTLVADEYRLDRFEDAE